MERRLLGPSIMVVRNARVLAGTIALGFITACSTACSGTGDGEAQRGSVGAVASALSSSAAHARVPRDLLLAIAKVEDGLMIPAQRLHLDIDNEVPAAGPLQLRHGKLDTLRRGAELTGVTELELRTHADLALEAGALVLAELGANTHARADDLSSWSEALQEMSGFADEARRQQYAHQVFATLARGGRFEARDGETVVLPQHPLPAALTIDALQKLHVLGDSAQFPGAEWIPTSCAGKCTSGRGGKKVEVIVIHDTEGNWNASVATLQNDPGKSAHYIIDVDGRLAQFVTEETTAWHAGNFDYNQRSIGIEHVGYATKPFAEAEYAASAKLVDHLATKYGVPRDRTHVIGHDQIPNGDRVASTSPPCAGSPKECRADLNCGGAGNHNDPGIWEWPTFMARLGGSAKCNDVTATWNCSNDKSKAFRCANGKVEVETCNAAGGCEVMGLGVDDVCHVGPKTAPQDPPAPVGTTNPPSAPPGAPPAEATTSGFLAANGGGRADDDAGCTIGRRRSLPGGWPAAIAGAVALLGARARRRRR